jgi:hypothetical protein
VPYAGRSSNRREARIPGKTKLTVSKRTSPPADVFGSPRPSTRLRPDSVEEDSDGEPVSELVVEED